MMWCNTSLLIRTATCTIRASFLHSIGPTLPLLHHLSHPHPHPPPPPPHRTFATSPTSSSASSPQVTKSGRILLLDDAIKAPNVRVLLPDQKQPQGPMTLREAKKLAEQHSLNLMQVTFPAADATGDAAIPICRLVNHNKMKYQEEKKEREKRKAALKSPELAAKRHASETKQIQFRDKIDPHDMNTKIRMINEWCKDGYNVRIQCKSYQAGESHLRIVMDKVIAGVTEGDMSEEPKMATEKMMTATFQKKKTKKAAKLETAAKPAATATAKATPTPNSASPSSPASSTKPSSSSTSTQTATSSSESYSSPTSSPTTAKKLANAG